MLCFFFFFQAEDGIRDDLVTGVQTCALPISHDQVEAMAIADRITLLNAGTIEQEGKPIELYTAPKSLFTAELMGSNNRLPGKLKEKFGEHAAPLVEGIRLAGMLRCATTTAGDAIGRLRRVRV